MYGSSKHLHDVPAAPVRALPQPGVRGELCPSRRDLQARGGRHRPDRPGQVPRLAHVRLGCPYKKIYYNWKSGKAEKCIFCYPRIEAGQPTVCSARPASAASATWACCCMTPTASRGRQRRARPRPVPGPARHLPGPERPEGDRAGPCRRHPRRPGWTPRNSPVYKMAVDWKVALPLHPEYRTLPMVCWSKVPNELLGRGRSNT